MAGPSTPYAVGGAARPSSHPIADTNSTPPRDAARETILADKMTATQALSAAMPYNVNKAAEHGHDAALAPPEGATAEPSTPAATGSTASETTASDKVGAGTPPQGINPANAPLDRVRVDSGGRMLTTNQGTLIADNQNSLKAGLRGPTLLEDFILREKITHFDHERIPERVVHARGSGAHGYFECYEALTEYTKAAPFAKAGKITPVFVRFSTVAGERGSTDLARDVRGFAVKFYTDEGNWDLVGNNMPVFFIQDAIKFPDLVHAVKPEPHHAMPQAASAHDTFWDFASLMPEITHMLMWVMSDRAIPRSFRMMQGFGVHTFRLVNAQGESVFVKFHWQPVAGTHSLVWDEAVKLSGADSDFHRRDLWEAIEAGAFPEWEMQLQIFTEEQAEGFSFDVLDATKIIPEELVPLKSVGKMVLNRNPDNFFAETEQVAFCTQHVVPGIDFSNDPLLQGRNFSYQDTQLSRLGGPNFHEIPINASIAQVHNNQRDGIHRQAIPRGRVSYEPNSLGGGCPFQAGMQGFTSFPQPIHEDKLRGKPEKFADHYTQARLFYNSQSAVEQAHIIAAFRFELTRVQTNAVRERMLSMLANVDDDLVAGIADGLGMEVPEAMPKALENPAAPEVEASPALSLLFRPGDGSIRTRRVAVIVADGVTGDSLLAVYQALAEAGATPRFVGKKLGVVQTTAAEISIEISMEAAPSVLFDALVLPDGKDLSALASDGHLMDFIKDQYRHCKPIFALGASSELLEAAGIALELPSGEADPGLVTSSPEETDDAITAFTLALAKHRHFERETDPPIV
ncbi:MAG: catalase [Burkholderiales bacterium]|nr:catalase [Burkholderiales bacterium]